jgi:phage/plasmid-like protein (TIGR03299 family)
MSHYFESGYSVRKPAWHGLGSVLQDWPGSWAEAQERAGLTWEPELRRLYRKIETATLAQLDSMGYPVDPRARRESLDSPYVIQEIKFEEANAQEVVRNDTGAFLGTVSDRFELLLNSQMGPIIETILEQPNVKFDTAGSLKGGRLVYVTALIDEPVQIKGDSSITLTYIVILNSHDGSGACKVLFTSVRVVCANTFGAADRQGDETGLQFSFRHTTGMSDRIAQAKDALQGARQSTMEWVETAEMLGVQPFGWGKQEQFIERFLAMPPVGSASIRVQQNVVEARSKLRRLITDRTNSNENGSALGMFNAAVEYVDHVRPYRTKETYMGRQLLKPSKEKARALSLVQELIAV